jgi:hypothetical protein
VLEASRRRSGEDHVPTIVLRGQYDGIAGFDDLIEFFKRLPNPDKQFSVLAGISHASFRKELDGLSHPPRLLYPARSRIRRTGPCRARRLATAHA